MERFHVVEDAAVILRSRGVYKQAKVYLRGSAVYAGAAGGFVRLYRDGGTGVPSLSWDDIDMGSADDALLTDALGKLSYHGPLKQLEAQGAAVPA